MGIDKRPIVAIYSDEIRVITYREIDDLSFRSVVISEAKKYSVMGDLAHGKTYSISRTDIKNMYKFMLETSTSFSSAVLI